MGQASCKMFKLGLTGLVLLLSAATKEANAVCGNPQLTLNHDECSCDDESCEFENGSILRARCFVNKDDTSTTIRLGDMELSSTETIKGFRRTYTANPILLNHTMDQQELTCQTTCNGQTVVSHPIVLRILFPPVDLSSQCTLRKATRSSDIEPQLTIKGRANPTPGCGDFLVTLDDNKVGSFVHVLCNVSSHGDDTLTDSTFALTYVLRTDELGDVAKASFKYKKAAAINGTVVCRNKPSAAGNKSGTGEQSTGQDQDGNYKEKKYPVGMTVGFVVLVGVVIVIILLLSVIVIIFLRNRSIRPSSTTTSSHANGNQSTTLYTPITPCDVDATNGGDVCQVMMDEEAL